MLGNVDRAMKALLIVGGINSLAVGAGRFDLLARLTGKRFGQTNTATRVVYGLVGGSALYTLSRWIQKEAFTGGEGNKGKRVREVMSKDPKFIEPSAPLMEAARLLKKEDIGALPVVEDGRLVGVLTDRDIAVRVVAEGKDPQSATVGNIASRDLTTASPEQNLDEALSLMARRQVRRLPVVEHGRLVGMLAQADVAEEAPAARTGEVVEKISR